MTQLLHIGLANVAVASLLAVLACLVGHFWRRPALVHCLWLLVLLKLVTPPLFWLPVAWSAAPEPASPPQTVAVPVSEVFVVAEPIPAAELARGGADQEHLRPQLERVLVPAEARLVTVPLILHVPVPPVDPPPPVPTWSSRVEEWAAAAQPWLPLTFWVWVVGAAAWFLWAGVQLFRFHRLLRFARPGPVGLQSEADRLAAQMGLTRSPSVWLLPGALPPLVWSGIGQARLFFPAGLLDKLGAEERATLLAHELAHICRRDHWVRLLEMFVLGVYWWCPLAWWARRNLQASEEECCDAWVVGELPARSYASAILHTLDFLAEHRTALPLGASGLSGRVIQLKKRLTQIMQQRTPKRLSSLGQWVVAGLGLLLLPLLPTVVLSRATADKPAPAEPVVSHADDVLWQWAEFCPALPAVPAAPGVAAPSTTLVVTPVTVPATAKPGEGKPLRGLVLPGVQGKPRTAFVVALKRSPAAPPSGDAPTDGKTIVHSISP